MNIFVALVFLTYGLLAVASADMTSDLLVQRDKRLLKRAWVR